MFPFGDRASHEQKRYFIQKSMICIGEPDREELTPLLWDLHLELKF